MCSTSPHDPNGHSALLVMCALENKAAIDRHAVIVHAQGIIDFNLSLPVYVYFKKYTWSGIDTSSWNSL